MRIAPISIYDVPAQQAWLEDMAAKGYFLDGYWTGVFSLASFSKGEPKAVRYRLEPAAAKEDCPDLTRREVYQSLGWDYVTTAGKVMHVWRSDDPAAPELHTEPETEARAYDHLCRTMRWLSLLTLVVALAPLMLALLLRQPVPDYFRRQVESWQPAGIYLMMAVAWCFLLWQELWESRSLRRYVRTLRAGVPADHRRPYRASRVLACVMMAVYTAFLAAQAVRLVQPNSWTPMPLDSFADPVPCVVLTEPENAGAIRWKNWRTAEQWWTVESTRSETEETGPQGPDRELFCEAHYYRLRLPWQSGQLVDSILAGYEDRGWLAEPLEVPGLDEAWLADTGDGYRFLILRLGDQVWDVSARNCGDLADRLDAYAAILAARRQRGGGPW